MRLEATRQGARVGARRAPAAHIASVYDFLFRERLDAPVDAPKMVSLFSGAGIGDLGYEQAGVVCVALVEKDAHRAQLCIENFPGARVFAGTVAEERNQVVDHVRALNIDRLDILSVTPPCQGMSSSNPGRGKMSESKSRDERNKLILDAIPIISALRPRIVVAENVVQVLKENIEIEDDELGAKIQKVVDAFRTDLADYRLFAGVVQMADYGVPQVRKRAVLVGVHHDEPCLNDLDDNSLLPWPKATHSEGDIEGRHPWVSLDDWLEVMGYSALDASRRDLARSTEDNMHFVPYYDELRYSWVADIASGSGANAYGNACRSCGHRDEPTVPICTSCSNPLTNRPHVIEEGQARLVKGFHSSYRRMTGTRPAPTITTATSHLGSDYKIHPHQNRVLSIRECADLQTVPRCYDWSWALSTRHNYVARQVIGEALPSWFTYQHGRVIMDLLRNTVDVDALEQEP